MKHPWANAFVLLLAAGSLLTGYFAFAAGEPGQAWHVSAHRVAGLAVVATCEPRVRPASYHRPAR